LGRFADAVAPSAKEDLPPKKKKKQTKIISNSILPMNCSASPEWI
jgi:hypothetical protein